MSKITVIAGHLTPTNIKHTMQLAKQLFTCSNVYKIKVIDNKTGRLILHIV